MKKYSTRKFSVLALLFLVVSVPLAIYSIVNLPSFNTKEKAANLSLDTETCQIRFPYVNPGSIEVNKTVQVIVSANTPQEAITNVSVMDRTGTVVFKKDFADGRDKISEGFTINPKEEGGFGLLGTLITDKNTRPCVIESKKQVTIVSTNTAPEFKTQPTAAKPSNAIKVNDSYQYQLEANDIEKDNINFAFSFTPNATWLKSTVIENGTSGKLSIKFTGTPDKPGSYLANIFIHDGYNAHLRAQTWVISVDQDKNDVPKVSIIKPATDVKINKGEKVTVSWEAADLNKIAKYELYIASNPGNENSWIAINKNISTKIGSYVVDTNSLKEGTYQFVVRAFDNFTPPAIGSGFSAKVTIGQVKQQGPDDGVVLQEAQIVNISPSHESSIKNKSAVISATLVPSKDSQVKKETVKMILDDQDITSKSRIAEGTDGTYSVTYTPEQPYSEGVHKVQLSFEDTKGNKATKDWTFTVIPEDATNTEVFKIFGLEIPKRIAIIVAAGLAILLLALIVPWLLYLAWKGTRDDDYEELYKNTTPISPVPPMTFAAEDKKEKNQYQPEIKTEERKVITPQFTFNKTVVKNTPPQPVKEVAKTEILQPTPVTINNVIPETPAKPVEVKVSMPEVKVNMPEIKPEPQIQPVSVNIEVPPVQQPIPVAQVVPQQPVPVISTPQPLSAPTVEQVEEEIEDDTNKELEALAEKLRAKEEMLKEFIPVEEDKNSNSAPSSLPVDKNSPQN